MLRRRSSSLCSSLFLLLGVGATWVEEEHHRNEWKNRLSKRADFKPMPKFRSDIAPFMRDCEFWRLYPNYYKRWNKSKDIKEQMKLLHEDYDLTCRPKPVGSIIDLGISDPDAVKAKLATVSEDVWAENAFRQQKFRVHNETESILLVWRQELLTDTEVKDRWAEWRPLVEPAIRLACEKYGYDYETSDVWKVMLARVPPGAAVKAHEDMAPALVFPHRIHWVISGEEGTQTMIGPDKLNVTKGQVFEFNNIMLHSVSNAGPEPRIHVIFDLVNGKLPPGLQEEEDKDVEQEEAPEPTRDVNADGEQQSKESKDGNEL